MIQTRNKRRKPITFLVKFPLKKTQNFQKKNVKNYQKFALFFPQFQLKNKKKTLICFILRLQKYEKYFPDLLSTLIHSTVDTYFVGKSL